jgi:hypothetical protein
MAELARLLPVIAIHPQSHELIMGGPGERRRLLDLGLFHVEQRFHSLWQRYRRALSQRNVLLRKRVSESELGPWEMELARTGEQLDEFRRHYVDSLGRVVAELAPALFGDAIELELEYRRGWHDGEGLAEALTRLRSRDIEQRVTGVDAVIGDAAAEFGGEACHGAFLAGQRLQGFTLPGVTGYRVLLQVPGHHTQHVDGHPGAKRHCRLRPGQYVVL